ESAEAHRQRELKWVSVMSSVPPSQSKKSRKVRRLLSDDVPSSVRYLVWSHVTDSRGKAVPGVYAQLSKRERIPAYAEIQRDVQQSSRDLGWSQESQASLLSLLQSYLTMVPDIHYSKGLTLISGHLLNMAPEEDAFWIFVCVMDLYLRPYFWSNTVQMEVDSALFARALEQNDALVAKKILTTLGVNPVDICHPWFSTLFVEILPPEYLNRVWDIVFFEGIPFLIRVGVVLIGCCRRAALEAPSKEILFRYLHRSMAKWLPRSVDAFLSLAHAVKLKDDDVRKQRIKMQAQIKRQTHNAPRM
ncbi:RabGAP/TBC, partial [Fistulina hepatica ATCC 64428]